MTDKIWLTCCALHNFLLEEDGLDDQWDMSPYMEDMGHHDDDDLERFMGCRRVSRRHREFDSSGMGPGSDRVMTSGSSAEEDETELSRLLFTDDDESWDGARKVRNMTLEKFRSKLVEHFDILWKQNKIQWPSRTGLGPMPAINSDHC